MEFDFWTSRDQTKGKRPNTEPVWRLDVHCITKNKTFYNAYTFILGGNMWYDAQLKIHPNGMATFKKN